MVAKEAKALLLLKLLDKQGHELNFEDARVAVYLYRPTRQC